MKLLLLTLFLFTSISIFACESESRDTCRDVQGAVIELADADHEDCCNEYCFCNCCNQISVISLVNSLHITVNYTSHVPSIFTQNNSDYFSAPWQPPKF